jgi:hypothetical protein
VTVGVIVVESKEAWLLVVISVARTAEVEVDTTLDEDMASDEEEVGSLGVEVCF